MEPANFAADGRLIYYSPTSPPLGRIVAKHAYDALGRLSAEF